MTDNENTIVAALAAALQLSEARLFQAESQVFDANEELSAATSQLINGKISVERSHLVNISALAIRLVNVSYLTTRLRGTEDDQEHGRILPRFAEAVEDLREAVKGHSESERAATEYVRACVKRANLEAIRDAAYFHFEAIDAIIENLG